MDDKKRELIHQLKNCLGPIQTFLQVVDTSKDKRLNGFQKLCEEKLVQLQELLKKLEEI